MNIYMLVLSMVAPHSENQTYVEVAHVFSSLESCQAELQILKEAAKGEHVECIKGKFSMPKKSKK